MARLLLILILIVGPPPVLGAWDFIERYLAPRADLLPHWQTHDPAAAETIDHSTWAEFLAAHVSRDRDGVNRVAYGNVSDADRERLAAYIARLTAVPIGRFSRAVQLAYWINLYNALTVDLVLSVYPIDSILDIDISPGILAFGPWDAAMTQVEGRPLSLNDIEHRILRPIWRDARIHYALNCASVGCPNLQPRPFTAANAEDLLDAYAREFINGPRGVRIDNGRLVVSKIYNWFADDFGGDDASIIGHLKVHALPPLAEALGKIEKIHRYEYDWGLNGEP